MSPELLIFFAALLPIIFRGVIGWRTGATLEMRHTLVYLFALLAALRYWKPGTETVEGLVSLDLPFIAAGVFLALYFIAALVAGLIVNLKGEFFRSVAPNPLDHALGALCGIFSGALLGGALVMLCALVLTGKLEGFDPAKIPARFDRFSVAIFQTVENRVAGIPSESSSRTQFVTPPEAGSVPLAVADPPTEEIPVSPPQPAQTESPSP